MGKNSSVSKATSKKTTSAASPTKRIQKSKTLKLSAPKRAPKAKSQFTKEVTLFRDQKDYFSVDAKYSHL